MCAVVFAATLALGNFKVSQRESIAWFLKERVSSQDTLYRIKDDIHTDYVVFLISEYPLNTEETLLGEGYSLEKVDADVFWNVRTCVRMSLAIASSTQLYFRDFLVQEDLSKVDVIYSYDLVTNELKYMQPRDKVIGAIYETEKGGEVYYFSAVEKKIFINKLLGDAIVRTEITTPRYIKDPENILLFRGDDSALYFKYKDTKNTYHYLKFNEDTNALLETGVVQPLESIKMEGEYKNVHPPDGNFVFKYGLANVNDVQIEKEGERAELVFRNQEGFLKYVIGALEPSEK